MALRHVDMFTKTRPALKRLATHFFLLVTSFMELFNSTKRTVIKARIIEALGAQRINNVREKCSGKVMFKKDKI